MMLKFERWTRDRGGLRVDGRGVVAGARPVRRADFAQTRAALLDDVGDAERAADLDELSARHEHVASRRRRRQHQQRPRGVVVREDRGLASEERAAKLGQMLVARAALSMLEIEFEVRVAGDEVRGIRPERAIDRRAPEVRVDDDAGGVDDTAERRGHRRAKPDRDVRHRLPFFPRAAGGPELVEMGADCLLHTGPAEAFDEHGKSAAGKDPLDGRNRSKRLTHQCAAL